MSDNDTTEPPYRASQAPNPRQPLTTTKTFAHVFVGSLLALALSAVWTSAGIKANLLAASRPERILVRIPTAVRVPVPCQEPATTPYLLRCIENVTVINLDRADFQTQDCIEGTIHTLQEGRYVVVECHCPSPPKSPYSVREHMRDHHE